MELQSLFSAISLGTLIRAVIVLLLGMLMVVVVVRQMNTEMRRK